MKARMATKIMMIVFILSLVVFSFPAHAQTITLRYSNFFPAPHKNSIIAQEWCKEVEKRTNGKVKINYYPGATLTPPAQTYDSVEKGIADIGESMLGYTWGKFPLAKVADLPLGFKTGYLATKAINAFYQKFKPKELDGTVVMFLHAFGPGLIHTRNREVTKLEDLKGLKLKSSGMQSEIALRLGAVPVGMPMTETYDAISKGTAEGVMCPLESMKGWKLSEVCNYTILGYGASFTSSFFVVMNKQKWNALPPDVKATIQKINEEWIEKQGKLWDEMDMEGKQLMQKSGKKIVSLSKDEDARWSKAVAPILADYVKTTNAKGLPGGEALKFYQDYINKHQR
jgi:TRAP-type C4-dicarboxylate transport system substrate-binding protein